MEIDQKNVLPQAFYHGPAFRTGRARKPLCSLYAIKLTRAQAAYEHECASRNTSLYNLNADDLQTSARRRSDVATSPTTSGDERTGTSSRPSCDRADVVQIRLGVIYLYLSFMLPCNVHLSCSDHEPFNINFDHPVFSSQACWLCGIIVCWKEASSG